MEKVWRGIGKDISLDVAAILVIPTTWEQRSGELKFLASLGQKKKKSQQDSISKTSWAWW
jgi:hypothetical protein